MSYKHKWVNDWARYVVCYIHGEVRESAKEPNTNKLITGKFEYLRKIQPQEAESILQRYTDQQMELEAQGWTLCEEGECPVDGKLVIDIYFEDGEGEQHGEAWLWTWKGSERPIIAYRLSNADGYKNGVKSIHKHESSHEGFKELAYIGKPKVIDGIPPLNIEIEFKNEDLELHDWEPLTILLIQGNRFWGKGFTQLINLDSCNYRPIQTDKERLIENAVSIYTIAAMRNGPDDIKAGVTAVVNMLSMPDKEEE